MLRVALGLLFGLLLSGGLGPVWGQDSTETGADSSEAWYEWAWSPIVSKDGVQISYLFYQEADNVNDGVVLRLRNTNDVAVRYSFTILFRGPEDTAQAEVEGRLGAGEVKTGDEDGLYWVPFREGRAVGRVGLRGIQITRVQEVQSTLHEGVKAPWRTERPPPHTKLSSVSVRTEIASRRYGGRSPFVGQFGSLL